MSEKTIGEVFLDNTDGSPESVGTLVKAMVSSISEEAARAYPNEENPVQTLMIDSLLLKSGDEIVEAVLATPEKDRSEMIRLIKERMVQIRRESFKVVG